MTSTPSSALTRRGLLAGAVATVAVASAGSTPAAAAAVPGAVRPVIRTVPIQIPLRYRYDPRTRVTTVTRFRRSRATVRFVGRIVQQRARSGRWVRIPYAWSARAGALVYSRYLHLALIRAAAPPPPSRPGPPSPQSPQNPPPPAQPPTPAPPAPGVPSTVTSVSPYVDADVARHLLRRAAYGPSDADLAEIAAIGPTAWLDRQLDPASIDDGACAAVLARLPDQAEPIWQVNALLESDDRNGWEQQVSVSTHHVIRAAWSRRQLLAVMEEFWGNHFNVTVPGDRIEASRAHYSHTIRGLAFGRFSDLLRAVSLHPAMLTYLNNRDSTREHPNENQGRELLELHTVGISAGYTEADVLTSARILTGLSVNSDSEEFQYKPWRHWTGAVSGLGFTHANSSQTGGQAVAEAFLEHLARHPATAWRVCWKLARHFVSDDPPTGLVQGMADTYAASGTAIAPVLRRLFTSPEFAAAAGAKAWRPYGATIATVRALGIGPDSAGTEGPENLMWLADDAGQAPFGAPYPTGWPDVTAAWATTAATLSRWNSTISIAAGWWPSTLSRPDLKARFFGPSLPATHGPLVDSVARVLFGRVLLPEHRAAALAFLGVADSTPVKPTSAAVGGRLPYLAALLLDSPYLVTR